MAEGEISAVFDCVVYLQGLLAETGPSAECLERLDRRQFKLVISDPILREIQYVLGRPELLTKYPQLSSRRTKRLIELLDSTAVKTGVYPLSREFCRDPKDEKYIIAAVCAGADHIVSRDSDLLDLMTGFDERAKDFRRRYRQLKIVSPVEFLEVLRRSENK